MNPKRSRRMPGKKPASRGKTGSVLGGRPKQRRRKPFGRARGLGRHSRRLNRHNRKPSRRRKGLGEAESEAERAGAQLVEAQERMAESRRTSKKLRRLMIWGGAVVSLLLLAILVSWLVSTKRKEEGSFSRSGSGGGLGARSGGGPSACRQDSRSRSIRLCAGGRGRIRLAAGAQPSAGNTGGSDRSGDRPQSCRVGLCRRRSERVERTCANTGRGRDALRRGSEFDKWHVTQRSSIGRRMCANRLGTGTN